MSIHIVVGKNFGDEGKGLAVDYFSYLSMKRDESTLVIRHNGGAQAGHTVDLPDKRFVFHQLSSGSFRSAHTLWSDTFIPDLYKLEEELADFYDISRKMPKILGFPSCRCVYIDDVLLNMAVETARADNRHGSCGMGINEAVQRSFEPDFLLTLGDIKQSSAHTLYKKLSDIRKNYLPKRLSDLGISLSRIGEYGELLQDDNVLKNVSEVMTRATECVSLKDNIKQNEYDNIVFEGAQGLLLDENFLKYAPHLTTSSTGSGYPISFFEKYFEKEKPQVVYISRTYVTRHGAGPLPYEGELDLSKYRICDKTNVENEWQGALRYALHGTKSDFVKEVNDDIASNKDNCSTALMLTHLNETNNKVCSTEGDIDVKDWCSSFELDSTFDHFYYSASKFSYDIT